MSCRDPLLDRREERRLEALLPDGTPHLRTFYLYLTNSCNMACRHCWIVPDQINGKKAHDYLDLDLLKSAIGEAKELGLTNVKLTGGEPVLHPQFCQILDLLEEENLGLVIESNGTLIDDRIASHLRKTSPDCFISISLDGSNAQEHDDLRGHKGSFDKVLAGLKNLVTHGFMPQVIMSVHRGNLADVENLIELVTELGAGSVKFNPVNSSGRGSEMESQGELLSYEEVIEFKNKVLGEYQQRFALPLFIMIPPALVTIAEILNRPFGFGNCNILGILGILGNGDLALCGIGRHLPELCFGRLGKDSIRDVWKSNPVLNSIRRVVLNQEYPGICGNCIHAEHCLMLCMAQNYLDYGKLVHPAYLCVEADYRDQFPETRKINMK